MLKCLAQIVAYYNQIIVRPTSVSLTELSFSTGFGLLWPIDNVSWITDPYLLELLLFSL